jgi:phosphotransferase system IIB component
VPAHKLCKAKIYFMLLHSGAAAAAAAAVRLPANLLDLDNCARRVTISCNNNNNIKRERESKKEGTELISIILNRQAGVTNGFIVTHTHTHAV